MQKKIIALAIAAAFSAPAFADVSMYGVADAAVVSVSADGQKSDLLAYSGGLSQSRLGVKAVEDLDNGMKAVVVLEYGLDAATGTSNTGTVAGGTATISQELVARQKMLALAGGFGTVAAGYLQTTGYDFASKFDPTAGSAVSPLQSMTANTNLVGTKTAAARAQRALAYISPNMGGLTVAVNYSTALSGLGNLTLTTAAAETKVTATLLSATYDNGPLSVGGVYAKTTNPSASSKQDMTEMALGGSFDLGAAKLFGTYQSNKADAVGTILNFESKVYSLSAVAPVGPGAIAFSYAKGKTSATGFADGGAGGYVLAWLQGLSKTTTLYAALENVSNDTGVTGYTVINNALAPLPTAGGSSQLIAVGLNKKF